MRAAQRARPRAGALVVLGVALLLSPSVLGTGTSAPWGAWTREVVEASLPDERVTFPQIALMPGGQPVVSFGQQGGAQVAARVGGVWLAETLPGYEQGGIAIDPVGNIHMSLRGEGAQLVYAKKAGPTWTFIPLQAMANIFSHPIAVSASGQPHFAYRNANSIHYATVDPATNAVTLESVDTRGLSASANGLTIAVDANGNPRIAYGVASGNSWDLIYASRSADGTWTREVALARCGFHTSLAMAGNTPHMSCQDEARGLIWVTRNGPQWVHEVIDATGAGPFARPSWMVGRYTDIAVDPEGAPHISYWVVYRCFECLFEPGQLHYATRLPTGWSKEIVDKVGQKNGDRSSIIVDQAGRPHTSYSLEAITGAPAVIRSDILYAEPLSPMKLGASP